MSILSELANWQGTIEIDGAEYTSATIATIASDALKSDSSIILHAKRQNATQRKIAYNTDTIYKITVKQYMTKPATDTFDFMRKWNNDVPMPFRTMVGTIEKETKGMVYMHLRADVNSKPTQRCMKCGKIITNPVSQYFGIGPECGGHNYVHPFASEAELKLALDEYRRDYLENIRWEGWIIKSAIEEQEVVED